MTVTTEDGGNGGIETVLATLQPIRDLAKNFDIDISTCLDGYLEDLVDGLSQETRQQVAATLNFTQAALVLQNSSGVYSRKVDYLHSYAYKVQEDLSLGSTTSKTGSKQKVGIDADLEAFLNFDPHQNFLLLDDVLPTDNTDSCQKINLPDSSSTNTSTNAPMFSASKTRLSIGGRLSMGTMTTTMDQSSNINAAVNVAAQRALIGSLDTNMRLVGDGCDIGEDGALLIPGTTATAALDSQENILQGNDMQQQQPMDLDNDTDDFGGGDAFDDGIDDDDDANEGAGFQMVQDDPFPGETKKRVTFAADTAVLPAPKAEVPKHYEDPWALLDPHTADKQKPRPLKIGKTIVLPNGMDKLPSECVTGTRTKQQRVARRERVVAVTKDETRVSALATFQASLGHRDFPNIPLTGLAYGNEFAYIAKATAKRKAEERRALRKQEHQLAAAATNNQEAPVDNDGFDGGGDDYGGGFDFGGDDDDDDFGGGGSSDAVDFGESNTGIASVDDVYQNRDYDDDLNTEDRTFEELCRAHIRAFQRGAEKYAAETQLSQRVGTWQAKLGPLLEEEERRPVFDIHAYGTTLIESLERCIRRQSKGMEEDDEENAKASRVVDFRDITRDCPEFEVCRMFLASLSLNNSGNIQFTESDMDELKIELLDSGIEHPMETYLAPSVEEKGE